MIKKLLLPVLVAGLLSCTTLSQLIQTPTVKLNQVKLTDFSFQDITLNFDLAVTNPNPFGIRLAGYDYDFGIQEQNFLSGDQTQDVQIIANQTSIVGVPVKIKFNELYQLFKAVQNQDEVNYQMKGHVHVTGPWDILKIPFSTSGKFPAIKLPKIALADVKIQSLSLAGIKLDLNIEVDNPNIFGFSLNNFNYNIALGGKKVASGDNTQATAIPQKGKTNLRFPIDLNFAALGSFLTSALQKGTIDYELTGGTSIATEFGNVQLPMNNIGAAKIWK